jgi:hypothetical protein
MKHITTPTTYNTILKPLTLLSQHRPEHSSHCLLPTCTKQNEEEEEGREEAVTSTAATASSPPAPSRVRRRRRRRRRRGGGRHELSRQRLLLTCTPAAQLQSPAPYS